MIEIYNVDLKQYPENTETLKSEAQKNGYWEELKKTYNTKEEAELIDLLEPPKRNDTEFPVEVEKGNIVYIPFFAEEKVTGYVIYGAEENNRIFKRDGKIFYLTNN